MRPADTAMAGGDNSFGDFFDSGRMTLRLVVRDADTHIAEILEQEVPISAHAVYLFLRRAPFRQAIAAALLAGGTVTIERKRALK